MAKIWNFLIKSGLLPCSRQQEIFDVPLERLIEPSEPLAMLANQLDWDGLEQSVKEFFAKTGRCGVSVRFAIGMLLLKSVENVFDEVWFEQWETSPYWQYFTGETYYQSELGHSRMGRYAGGARVWVRAVLMLFYLRPCVLPWIAVR